MSGWYRRHEVGIARAVVLLASWNLVHTLLGSASWVAVADGVVFGVAVMWWLVSEGSPEG